MRIFITMLGYNRADMVKGALENLEATTTDEEHRRLVKTIFLCQYPLPTVEQNRTDLNKLAADYGWWRAEIPNEGVMGNHNRAIHEYCHMSPGDFYVTFDPDVRMQEKGWISAMVQALNSDPSAMFVCASRPFHDMEWCAKQHGRTISTLPSGLRISRYNNLLAWSMGMWKAEYLINRPRDFKQMNAYYGYSEHADADRLRATGKTWMQLTDFYDHHLCAIDPNYTEWKKVSASGATNKPFDQWLRGR